MPLVGFEPTISAGEWLQTARSLETSVCIRASNFACKNLSVGSSTAYYIKLSFKNVLSWWRSCAVKM